MDNKDKKDMASGEEKELFSNLEFSYSRSKEDVWNVLDGIIGEEPSEEKREKETESNDGGVVQMPLAEKPDGNTKVISINWVSRAIAASIVLLLTAGLFVRFYSKTISVAPGEFISHTLPDGSEIHLNAATSISYNPYWWRVDRAVKLEGEAYFVVAKGEKFSVFTTLGTTEVLGTEFNVYARGDDFQVYCEEGRVRVSSEMVIEGTQDTVILKRGQLAVVELNHLNTTLVKQTEAVPDASILSWRSGKFLYNNTPMAKVFGDIERHYGITISFDDITIKDLPATSRFDRSVKVESALDVVCTPNGLIYTKSDEDVYLIKRR